jgi:catechol 2,3-dioxygenase-like lactoylglutathione lyase family enzyme
MIKYKGINHLAMVTNDMDQTIRFWRDLLGMRLVAGLGRPGYRHYFFEISENDLVAFFEWPEAMPVEEKEHGYPVKGPVIFDHVSFGVESEADLWRLKDTLEAADMWVSEVMDHGFIHSIYTFDPNGIPIEFSHDIPEVDVRKEPRMVDREPSKTCMEGPDPRPNQWPAVLQPTPVEERAVYAGQGEELLEEKRRVW